MRITNQRLASALVFAGALLFAPMRAFAVPQDITLPAGGAIAMVGMVGDFPVVVSWNPNFLCDIYYLGTAGTGALEGSVTVTGSSSADWIVLADTTGSHCGYTITPLNTGSYTLTVRGSGGDDIIEGRSTGAVRLHGDAGADWVTTVAGGQYIEGEGGADLIVGSWFSTVLGEGEADDMCAVDGSAVWQFIGGPGADTWCGGYFLSPSSALEDCGPCP